jgi:hypothetical protein
MPQPEAVVEEAEPVADIDKPAEVSESEVAAHMTE